MNSPLSLQLLRDAHLVIVGAGFYGASIAQQAANAGYRCVVVDRRDHIGGNAYSSTDKRTGIEVHQYGPHIFHTNSQKVFDYLSQFTDWTPFELRTWTVSQGRVYPLPINLATICLFLKRHLSPSEALEWIDSNREATSNPSNLEEKAISLIGRPLYEAFVQGYTQKQWQTDPKLLPADIITRLPVRLTFDNRYFNDQYQCMPTQGYTRMFERMLSNPLVAVSTNTTWQEVKPLLGSQKLVYTGAIDEFFDYQCGVLGWRTVDFKWEYHPSDYQGVFLMNYADQSVPWTRIAEYRHAHPERDYGKETIIAREFSRSAGAHDTPYYPINTQADQKLLAQYQALADATPNVVFGGRLATYRYLDMHQAVGMAIRDWDSQVLPMLQGQVT